MKGTYRAAVVITLVMILLMNPTLLAWGNPVPGRWEKVVETEQGDWMTVYVKDGPLKKCRFHSITGDYLICVNKFDEKLQIELTTIDKVVLRKVKETANKWALWGVVGGGVGGAAYILPHPGNDLTTTGNIVMIAIFAGLGAGVGYITGAAFGTPGETVYVSKELAMQEAAK